MKFVKDDLMQVLYGGSFLSFLQKLGNWWRLNERFVLSRIFFCIYVHDTFGMRGDESIEAGVLYFRRKSELFSASYKATAIFS